MPGKFELKTTGIREFRFVLKAGNHQVILSSQSYDTKAAALADMEAVRVASQDDARFERRTSRGGEPYFVLYAANGQVLGTSEMYSSVIARDNGIRSVGKNSVDASIKDMTESVAA